MSKILSATEQVFKKKVYFILFSTFFLLFLLFSIYLPNFDFLIKTLFASYALSSKLKIFIFSLGAFQTNFTLFGKITSLILAFLVSLNFTLLIFYIKKTMEIKRESGSSFLGTLLGILGIGCTSCGSVILSSILGVSTTSAFLGILPFAGKELGLFGILFLIYSIYLISKKILSNGACKI